MKKYRIAVVDDDKKIRDSLAMALRLEGYEVATIENGNIAYEFAQKNPPDLWLIDIMMPIMDGITLTLKLRDIGIDDPIIMITAKDQKKDIVRGLNAGADDYLAKPYDLEELLTRVKVIKRRTPSSSHLLSLGDLKIESESHKVFVSGESIELTKTEYDILHLLVKNQGKTVTYEELHKLIWGEEELEGSKSIPVYIKYLKNKLGNDFSTKYIHNVRGTGYMAGIR